MRRPALPKYRTPPPALTPERVTLIRSSGLPDTHWARIWRVSAQTIGAARRGETWRENPTPPDTKPRVKLGYWENV